MKAAVTRGNEHAPVRRLLPRRALVAEAGPAPGQGVPPLGSGRLRGPQLPGLRQPAPGAYGGRPHWGKLHFQTAETLAPRYPQWDAFQKVRARLDPQGTFTNAYLDRVLGPVGG